MHKSRQLGGCISIGTSASHEPSVEKTVQERAACVGRLYPAVNMYVDSWRGRYLVDGSNHKPLKPSSLEKLAATSPQLQHDAFGGAGSLVLSAVGRLFYAVRNGPVARELPGYFLSRVGMP